MVYQRTPWCLYLVLIIGSFCLKLDPGAMLELMFEDIDAEYVSVVFSNFGDPAKNTLSQDQFRNGLGDQSHPKLLLHIRNISAFS